MFKRYSVITAALAGVFMLVGSSAGAATLPTTPPPVGNRPAPYYPHSVAKSVCDTGYRGQKTYDALCLRTGTPADARKLWFDTAEGVKGRERDDMVTRRSICKFAPRHGGIMKWAAEFVYDMTYDTYRNNGQVNTWVGQDARLDCQQMGYRV